MGDIFDRGAGSPQVMDELLHFHSLDIQWGNHDIIWMGGFSALKPACSMPCVLQHAMVICGISKKAYGLNLRALTLFADRTYKANLKFRPILGHREDDFTAEEILQLEKVHQALTIIQFKLESQLKKTP